LTRFVAGNSTLLAAPSFFLKGRRTTVNPSTIHASTVDEPVETERVG
jgi:hypothetical protein